ncbi:MADF domain [Cinara cedri]|uniref:MADF domain n=1 Tax=Cinara cedri TaxID=506608 RepID=A0A5E4LY43_9HEMI|nr:MADF domain [Cinara cedri]
MNCSGEQTIYFIETYRDRSLSWDPNNSQYKNKNKRRDGLTEIAISFGMEKFDVEKKIKNLQSRFAREKKKEKESRKTGSGAGEAYTSKWFGYDSMLFLANS